MTPHPDPAKNNGGTPRGGDGDRTGRRAVLVTGGAGFIGSHLVRSLVSQGLRVTVVDNLSTGRLENLADLRDNQSLTFIEADLTDALRDGALGSGYAEIYHLAAAVGVDFVMNDPIRAIEINVEQAAPLFRYASNNGAPPVFVASSSEVYGKPTTELFCEDDDAVYGATTTRRWSYALSKALDEHLALAYHESGRCPAVVGRFFNTVGPRQVGTHGMVLPRFVRSALAGEPLRVFGDGTQSRCFCDVRDVVSVVPALVRNDACHGRVFNIGSDVPISIAELAGVVTRTLGSGSEIELIPYSDAYPKGYEDLRQRQPDLSRVREAVGFEPKITLEQTITDLADDIRGGGQPAAAQGATR
ncbi:MAG: NAD-dependent epimerase/dehydratase family protein [Planctomycetota bacterium]